MHALTTEPHFTPDERQAAILALLASVDRLPVAGLAERFGTSDDSIRRDLRVLVAENRIRRVHGAILPARTQDPFDERAARRASAKAAIAEIVLPLIAGVRSLSIDGGTTTLAVASALPADRPLTILTTSLPVVSALADHPLCELVVAGGHFDRESRTVVGSGALAAIAAFRADACLLGLCSIDPDAGVTAVGYEEAAVKRALIEGSGVVIAVATHEKIGAVSPNVVGPVASVHHLVTDRAPAPPIAERLRAAGVTLHFPAHG